MARIFSVIVNWNSREDTLACVESLQAAGAPTDRVVVVDNASEDGSVEALRSRFGTELSLLASPENLGYAAGVNAGVARAREAGADWLFLLNNDTVVEADIFDAFRAAIDRHREYAIWAPLILYHNQPERIWSFGDRRLPGTLITLQPYRGRSVRHPLPDWTPVDFASGAGMLVATPVFENIGGFDRALFMYGEEIDFCWRARLAGFRIAALRAARMWHRVSGSARRVAPRMQYLKVRNQSWFYRRYARGLSAPLMFLFSALRNLLVGLADLFKGRPELVGPLARGWYEGWFGQVPEPET